MMSAKAACSPALNRSGWFRFEDGRASGRCVVSPAKNSRVSGADPIAPLITRNNGINSSNTASGRLASVERQVTRWHEAPCSAANARNSVSSRLLPIPASPQKAIASAWPSVALRSARASRSIKCSRPRSGASFRTSWSRGRIRSEMRFLIIVAEILISERPPPISSR